MAWYGTEGFIAIFALMSEQTHTIPSESWWQRSTGWSLVLLVFLIPFPGKVPVAAVYVFGLFSLGEIIRSAKKGECFKELKTRISDALHHRILWIFFLLPLLYLAGVFWSSEGSPWVFELEKKSLLLLFPLLAFVTTERVFDQKWLNRILAGFTAGTFIITLYLLIAALKTYSGTSDLSVFFYSKFSQWLHPSYLAMYVCFSMGITMYLFVYAEKKLRRWHWLAGGSMMLWWVSMVVLLGSKAGFLGLMIALGFLAYLLSGRWRRRSVLILLGICLLILVPSVYIAKPIRLRLASAWQNITSGTTISPNHHADGLVVRWESWKIALDVWKAFPITGTGTGDYASVTTQRIEERGLLFPFDGYKNAHNQYLQTAATLGTMGLLIFLAWLLLPVFLPPGKPHGLQVFFLILTGFNLLAESMLEAQAGVIFITIMHVLFCRHRLVQ